MSCARGGSIAPLPISNFLTQNIGDIDISMHQELHWLDIPERVNYKPGVLTHRCLLGKAPVYLSNCCIPVSQVATWRHLRSAARHQLTVSRHHLSIALTVGICQMIYEILQSAHQPSDSH